MKILQASSSVYQIVQFRYLGTLNSSKNYILLLVLRLWREIEIEIQGHAWWFMWTTVHHHRWHFRLLDHHRPRLDLNLREREPGFKIEIGDRRGWSDGAALVRTLVVDQGRSREIGLGFCPAKSNSCFVVGTSRCLGCIESAKPDSSLLHRISDLRGVTTPWPLSHSSITVFFLSAVAVVCFNGRRFTCRRRPHLDKTKENYFLLQEGTREVMFVKFVGEGRYIYTQTEIKSHRGF